VAIDIEYDEVMPLSQAAGYFPVRPSLRTLWRWHHRGVRGIKLETALVGGRRVTSREAVRQFLGAINAPASRMAAPVSARRQREADAAERELAQEGI